jgi:hypothetical protein
MISNRGIPMAQGGKSEVTALPTIIYLDQNAWVALARAKKAPDVHALEYDALEALVNARNAGWIQVPLSFTNIYETHKINDPERRAHLAWVQCTLSQGQVFRGRAKVLRHQLTAFLASSFGISEPVYQPYWFLSELHFESVHDYDPTVFKVKISDALLAKMRARPAFALFHYLTELDEETRRTAVKRYSAGSADLLAKMEARRARISNESFDMRRRIYSVQLLWDHVELIEEAGRGLGIRFSSWTDLGKDLVLALPDQVPVFNIERELAIRTEAESRQLSENDLRDVASFYTVLPYADIVIAEKALINRARQAGLGMQYDTELLVSLSELPATLAARASRMRTDPSAERN